MKFVKMFLLLIIALLLCSVGNIKSTKADGGIFYPPNYYSAQTTQKAFIYFANQKENLVVLTGFKGNAKDFVWIIPTPSQPEINKGSIDLFNNLAEITKTDNGTDIIYSGTSWGLSGASKSTPVEVISEKTIDVYDTAVLKASDENALAKWLTDHGYSFPPEQSPNLKNYVDNGWYFAIAKIKADLISSGGIVPELAEGTLTPLRLSFQSEKIIYPMRLTGIALMQAAPASVSANVSSIPITLYVLSDHKTEQKLLVTTWANWIDQTEINKLNSNLDANVISEPKLFLTKMSNAVDVKNINDDFIIGAVSDNLVYPTPVYKTAGFWLENLLFLIIIPIIIIFIPIPLGLIFIVFILLQIYVKKKWLYILGSIYQILSCFILLAIIFTILIESSSDLKELWFSNGFIGGMMAAVALLILGVYVTVKMLKRYKKTFSFSNN